MAFAKKSLGQNFLISPRVTGAIADAGDIREGETVLEIGPGKGVLTKALLERGARVVAVEKDDRLIPILHETFSMDVSRGALSIVHGDIMDKDAASLGLAKGYKVIANIPYYITGAIARNFLSAEAKPALMVLMVQKEVAERVIARDGKESILSLSIKAYAKPSLVMSVSRGNFFPIPNVDSAVLKLSDIRSPFANKREEERFFEVVKAGFAQKRKKLLSNLSSVSPKEKLGEMFAELGIGENARAEDFPLDKWLALSKRA
ncbi:MAG: ribosomal RNA small subunit methyltransferase A [Candidatus Taylorbacteria bacterium]|nr:ribosomal RNA small subunit methyltransferase A [Candidatus Taylorbacteria bacterium]